MAPSHEEADTVITQQANMAAQKGSHVTVIADDVDVFVLVYYYQTCELASHMYIVSSVREQASTDIAETTTRIKDIAGDLPAPAPKFRSLPPTSAARLENVKTSKHVLSFVLVKVVGSVATHNMMISACLMMLMPISLLIDRCLLLRTSSKR